MNNPDVINPAATLNGGSLQQPCSACARPWVVGDANMQQPARWLSPMGNPLCDRHREIMDKLYVLTDARCTMMPNDQAMRPEATNE